MRMSMTNHSQEELKTEIECHLEASKTLGRNIRPVELDTEYFVESIADLIVVERMKARLDTDIKLLHFQAGEAYGAKKVVEYLTRLCDKQTDDRKVLLQAVIQDLREKRQYEDLC